MGAPTLQEVPTYDFAKISQKLHEIKRIWIPGSEGGDASPKFYYVDPSLEHYTNYCESGHLLNFLVLNVFSFGRRSVTAAHFIICAVALLTLLGISESGWCTFD